MSAEQQLYDKFGNEFPPGHILFHDGDAGQEMFVIQSGKVRISKNIRGVEKTLVTLGAGEFFGEMSILNSKPRSATATCEDPTKLLVIDPKTFEAMVRGNAEIAIRMIKKLAARLQEADEQIENLLLKDHNSRVVHCLSAMASKYGKETEQGIFLETSTKDLAGKVGLEEGQVSEVLQKLLKANLCKEAQGGLLVGDANKLRQFLEFLEMKEKFGDL